MPYLNTITYMSEYASIDHNETFFPLKENEILQGLWDNQRETTIFFIQLHISLCDFCKTHHILSSWICGLNGNIYRI